MIINNSKKALAAKIRNSGFAWPDSGKWAIQDKDGEVFVCSGISVPVRRMGEVNWEFGEPYRSAGILSLGPNWFQCILSRDEYFHLYPTPDADGWIEWHGGECPVRMAMVDVKFRQGGANNQKAHILDWSIYGDNDSGDIIAYRLHKPEQQKSTAVGDDETNLAAKEELEALEFGESPEQRAKLAKIYAPSIEQLASEYRTKLALAKQAQEEADSHRCGAEAALEKLYQAGLEIGLDIAIAEELEDSEPESEPLNITDWRDLRVGDVIWIGDSENTSNAPSGEYTVTEFDPEYIAGRTLSESYGIAQPIKVNGGHWPDLIERKWRFIRRP